MIGQDRILQSLSEITKKSENIDFVSACFYRSRRHVTKFGSFKIIQNLEEEGVSIYIKVVHQQRIGVSICDSLEKENLRKALDRAVQISKVAPKNPFLSILPKKGEVQKIQTHFPQTKEFARGKNYDTIKKLFEIASRHDLALSGSLLTGEDEMAVVNSEGAQRYQPFSDVSIKLIPAKDGSTGYGGQVSRNIDEMDFEKTLQRGIEKCLQNKDQQDIELGEYDCILEPEAVAEILEWLGFIGFGAKSFYEKTGFSAGNIEQKIMGENITITDDGLSPESLAIPFDFEGVPRKKVALIDKGICKGFVLDSHYGEIYKKESTGHALAPDETEGPFPLNLTIEPGAKSTDEMIKMVKKGILISRFHYVNGFIDPHRAVMTGLTRDGTFLIEDGKIKSALKNMRFTQPMLEAFSRVKAISKTRRLVGDPCSSIGSALVPSLLIQNFTFTGKTS